MFVAKPKRIALTLLCSLAVVLALTSSAEANPQHRDHVVLHRMIKKRADNPFLNIFGNDNNNAGSVGAASDPPSDNASSSSVASAATSSSVAASSSAASSSVASASSTASASSAVSTSYYQQYQYVHLLI